MQEVVIVSTARTPVGAFNGALSTIPAPKLSAITIKAALERAGMHYKYTLHIIYMFNLLHYHKIFILSLLIFIGLFQE